MRDVGPVFFFILVFVVIAVVALVSASAQQQRRREILEQLARRFRGRLENVSLFTMPQLRLRFQDYPALLRYAKVGKNSHHTQFTITWPEPRLRCEIYPQDMFSGFRKLSGMEDIEIGSPQFDAAYFISGNNRAQVRDLLSAEVQAIIFKLARLEKGDFLFFGTRDIQVKWVGGTMTVTKPAYLTSYESLEPFLLLSAELFIAALNTRQSGITFVEPASGAIAAPDATEAVCQVCGEELRAELVYCSACKTPHHSECWEYFGGCSTYACGNKQFVTRGKRTSSSKQR